MLEGRPLTAVPSIGAKIANSIDPDHSKRRNVLDVATDFLSTGNYAAAGFVNGVLEALQDGNDDGLDLITKPLGGAAHGVKAGFTGESPVRYGDVLRKMGAPDRVASIGGLVGDVLLDPLNFVSFFSPTKLGHAAELYTTLKKAGTLEKALETNADLAKFVRELGPDADRLLTQGHSWVDRYHRGQMALANIERPTGILGAGEVGHLLAATRPGQAVMKSAAGPAFKAVGDALKYVPIAWKTTPFMSSKAILPALQAPLLQNVDAFLRAAREDIPGLSHAYQAIGNALVPYFRPKGITTTGWNTYADLNRKWQNTLGALNQSGEEAVRGIAMHSQGPMEGLAQFLERHGYQADDPTIEFLRNHAAQKISTEDQQKILASLQRPYHTNVLGDIDRTVQRHFGGLTPDDVRAYSQVDPSRFAREQEKLAKAIDDERQAMRLADPEDIPLMQEHLNGLIKRHEITFGPVHESVDADLYKLLEQSPEDFTGAMQQRIEMLGRHLNEVKVRREQLLQWYKDSRKGTLMPSALEGYTQKLRDMNEDIAQFEGALAAHHDLGRRVEDLRLSEADRAQQRVQRAQEVVKELNKNELIRSAKAGAIPKYADEADNLAEVTSRLAREFGHDNAAMASEFARRIADEPLAVRARRLSGGDPEVEAELLQRYLREARDARRAARLASKEAQTKALTEAGVIDAADHGTLVMVNATHPQHGDISVARGANGKWEAVRFKNAGKHAGERVVRQYDDVKSAMGHLMDEGYVFDPQAVHVLPEGINLSPETPPMTRERAHREIEQLAKRLHGGKRGRQVANATQRLIDSEAATWAERTGRSVNEYYALRIAGFTRKAPPEGAFFQSALPSMRPDDVERVAREVAAAHNANGGSSVHPTAGDLGGTDNIAVSMNPDRSAVIDGKEITPEQVKAFAEKNADLLSDGRHFIGTWFDEASGKTYVDVSMAVPDLAAARALGERANQKAAWDLKHFREIPLSGTGDAAGVKPITQDEIDAIISRVPERAGVRRAVRFGRPGLTELDPANPAIRNLTVPGAEDARRANGAPAAFNAYTHRTPYEAKVVRTAQARYSFDVPEHRLYNLAEDPEHILHAAAQAGNTDRDAVLNWAEHEIKRRGYAGYINPNSGLPGGIVMLDKVGPEARLMEHPASAPWEKDLPDYYGAMARETDELGQVVLDSRGRPRFVDPFTSSEPRHFTSIGEERGLKNIGPGEAPVAKEWHDDKSGVRRTFMVPGGVESGKFTLWDLSYMANQGVDLRSLYKADPEFVHALYRKMGRTLHVPNPTDEQVYNRIIHSFLSIGTKLRMNQLEMSVFRAIERSDIERMATLWRRHGEFKSDSEWAAWAKKGLGTQKMIEGGLGFPMKGDQLLGLAKFSDDFLRDPAWYRKRPDESMTTFIARLETSISGLGIKTASWAAIPQDMIGAWAAAFDTHMVRNSWNRVFTKEDMVAESKRLVTAYNKKIEKYNARVAAGTVKGKARATVDSYEAVPKTFVYEYFAGKAMDSRPISINSKRLPEELRAVDWGDHLPANGKVKVMSEFYQRMLDDVAKKATANGLSPSAQQWLEWDLMRDVFEPHHHFFPEWDALPRMSTEQLHSLRKRNIQRMYTNNNRKTINELMASTESGGVHEHPNQDVMFQQGPKGPRGAVSVMEDGRRWVHLLNQPDPSTWAHEAFHLFQDHVDDKLMAQFGVEPMARMFERYIATGKAPVPELQPAFDEFGALVRRVTRNGDEVPETVRTEFDNLFSQPYVKPGPEAEIDVPHSVQDRIRSTWGQSPGRHLSNVEDVINDHLKHLEAYGNAPFPTSPVSKARLLRHQDEIRSDLNAIINAGQAPPYKPQYRARAQQLLEKLNRATGAPLDLLPSEARRLIEPRRQPPRFPARVPETKTFEPLPRPGVVDAATAERELLQPRERRPLGKDAPLSNDELLYEGEEHYASYVTMLRRMAQDNRGTVDGEFLQRLLDERFAQSPKLRRATATEIAADIIRLNPEQQHRRHAIELLLDTLLQTEQSRGIFAGLTHGYFPRYRIENENAGWLMGARGLKVPKKSFERARALLKDHPLEAINDYARAIGLKDIYDERLPEVLGMRVKDHNVAITTHDFFRDVVGELGVKIDPKMARSHRFLAHQVMEQLGMDPEAIKEAHALADQLNAWGVAKDGKQLLVGRALENLKRTGRLDGAPLQFKFHLADRIDGVGLRGVSWDDPRELAARVDAILAHTPQGKLQSAAEAFQADIQRAMQRYHEITPEVGIYTSRLAFSGTNIDDNNFLDALNLVAGTPYRAGEHVVPLTPDQLKSAMALREGGVFVLPKAIADDLNLRISNHFRLEDTQVGPFLRAYDKVIDTWKKLTLYLFPQFHTRNAMTNVATNTMSAGLHDFHWYEDAGKLQLGHEVSFTDRAGRTWDRESLMRGIRDHGIESGGQFDVARYGQGKLPSLVDAGAYVANRIEQNARIALYLDGLNRGMSEYQAAVRTKRFLFDYGELTDFEKTWMRRLMPFYTWTRKNLPLQIQQLVTRPFRYGAPLKAAGDLSEVLSGDRISDRDRAALPAFMQDALPVRHKVNPDGTQELFLMGNWLPLNDLLNVTDPGAMAYGMITPVKGFWEAYVANWNPYFDRAVERYPGETQDFLGMRIGAKERYMLRNLRLLNEIDKSLWHTKTVRGRVAQAIVGQSYTVDMDKAREQRLRDFRATVTRLQNAQRKEDRKDAKTPRTVDIGASHDYYRQRIETLRQKMREVR